MGVLLAGSSPKKTPCSRMHQHSTVAFAPFLSPCATDDPCVPVTTLPSTSAGTQHTYLYPCQGCQGEGTYQTDMALVQCLQECLLLTACDSRSRHRKACNRECTIRREALECRSYLMWVCWANTVGDRVEQFADLVGSECFQNFEIDWQSRRIVST